VLKSVEKESLLKSFFLFFISQIFLAGALFYLNFQKEQQNLDAEIFSEMRVCSFTLHCSDYKIDFAAKKGHELYKLYKEKDRLSAYFTIPGSKKNYLKIYLQKSQYENRLELIKKRLIVEFFVVATLIAILSLIFALYTLRPLRDALHLTEEFIKDILHDFNTPISVLRLNLSMLETQIGNNPKIDRTKSAIANILALQSNLKSYLNASSLQKEHFQLRELLRERIEMFQSTFVEIDFILNVHSNIEIYTNKDAFIRIIDNLLSNAAKYNKKGGSVTVGVDIHSLIIEDSGKGIKNPKKVFERFYKEQQRGIGIGLHIVKKLCDELGIVIDVESQVGHGTKFMLNLSKIISH
jgi:signal transduction histidine kinase